MFDVHEQITANTVANFYSEDELLRRSALRLRDAGFEILQVTDATINIAGSPKTYQEAFNTKLYTEERPVIKPGAVETMGTFIDSPSADLPGLISVAGTPFEDVLEGVAIEEPRYEMAELMFPPLKEYWHLNVPDGVAVGCNASRAHRGGTTGRGIKVAMVDSGWYQHSFFVNRGYRASPVVLGPAAANPTHDESGHGTGESANVFAIAPDVQLLPVKVNFVNSVGAFNAAVGLGPDIITCSWGSSVQNGPLSAANQTLATAIATAVANGIIVVFSAGNGHWGFPGQHPDVISAGGVFMDHDESLRASDYASGFMSNIYPNRRVPDLSGLVGMRPKAIYIMLPVEPGDSIDSTPASSGGLQGGTFPNGDETTANDGWGAFSGTSAAAPQIAGAAALVKQACPRLTPAEVKDILMKTARDVTAGNCSPSTGANPAVVGPDTATGNGLLDAHKAVLVAKVRCTGPIRPIVAREPIRTIEPREPVRTIQPREPVQPRQPIQPREPIQPRQPIQPREPIQPRQPIQPREPIQPRGPIRPLPIGTQDQSAGSGPGEGYETDQGEGGQALSADDIDALEDMIIKSDVNDEDIGS